MHEAIADLAFLAGVWRGEGAGSYPTIDDFSYVEEVTFRPGPDKPFLVYTQRTWRAGTGEPLHSEAGYLRGFGDSRVELVIAQPTGIVEVGSGHLAHRSVTFECRAHTTPAARPVRATHRTFSVDGDRLDIRLSMAAVSHPLTHHLAATLTRVDD